MKKLFIALAVLLIATIAAILLPTANEPGSKDSPSATLHSTLFTFHSGSSPSLSSRGTRAFLLASAKPFTKSLRLAAESLGARIIGVYSPVELIVEADEATRAKIVADGRFSVSEIKPSSKISDNLAELIAGGAEEVLITLVTLSPADRELVKSRVEAGGGEILAGCLNGPDSFCARVSSDLVADLADHGDVRWMERFERPVFLNDRAVEPVCMNVRDSWNVHGLTGAGQFISTSDSGIDTGDLATMHPDLTNHVVDIKIVPGCYTSDASGHGTHTAGSICGDGTLSDGQIRGTAYGAKLYAWFCSSKTNKDNVITPDNCSILFRGNESGTAWTNAFIHSASWGSSDSSVIGRYISQCYNVDSYVWNHPDFLPVFAAGNSGSKGSTVNSPATAKNVLAVGATQSSRSDHGGGFGNGNPAMTASFSSRGPCFDGRIKPDIAAPGVGILSTRSRGVDYSFGVYSDDYAFNSGTSMACPLVAGGIALIREWLVTEAGYTNEPPSAALMKAIVTGGAKGVSTPDNSQGWGRADITETLFPSNRAIKIVDRIPFDEDAVFIYDVVTTNAAPLEVQLAWIDYPGDVFADQSVPRLVNDLDLSVQLVDGGDDTVHYGNGGTGPDRTNNLESVRIVSAVPGMYRITVDCNRILYDYKQGGAAALYVRGAFESDYIDKNEYVTLTVAAEGGGEHSCQPGPGTYKFRKGEKIVLSADWTNEVCDTVWFAPAERYALLNETNLVELTLSDDVVHTWRWTEEPTEVSLAIRIYDDYFNQMFCLKPEGYDTWWYWCGLGTTQRLDSAIGPLFDRYPSDDDGMTIRVNSWHALYDDYYGCWVPRKFGVLRLTSLYSEESDAYFVNPDDHYRSDLGPIEIEMSEPKHVYLGYTDENLVVYGSTMAYWYYLRNFLGPCIYGTIGEGLDAPSADADGDGFTNEEEYNEFRFAGIPTDPLDDMSFPFRFTSPTSFIGRVGMDYKIQYTTNLENAVWTDVPECLESHGFTNVIDLTKLPVRTNLFYRSLLQ